MRFLHHPRFKITLGSTAYEDRKGISCTVVRNENGFDAATVQLAELLGELYPNIVTAGTAIQIDVKDAAEASYPANPVFKGVVRFPVLSLDNSILLKCDGAGYGLGAAIVGQEYGANSPQGSAVDTLSEILTHASYGIITKWVNKVMESANASGFSYSTSIDANLTDTIGYISFPYKPALTALNDLTDLLTAIRVQDSNKGVHWIVTTDDYLRMKELYSHHADWPKFYGGSVASQESKLYQGKNISACHFEKLGILANYILYYGFWRRPSNGDSWTLASVSDWAEDDMTISIDTSHKIVGANSLKAVSDVPGSSKYIRYPSGADANWNFEIMASLKYVPHINFYVSKHQALNSLILQLCTDSSNLIRTMNFGYSDDYIKSNDKFYFFSIPISTLWDTVEHYPFGWNEEVGTVDWSEIDYLEFLFYAASANDYIHIDGLNFSGGPVCRVARKPYATISSQKFKARVITDNIAKDDTLLNGTPGTTDTGLMARMAYAELLKCQSQALVGWIKTPMMHKLLPGQLLEIFAYKSAGGSYRINGTEMRVTKIEHAFSKDGAASIIHLTDDVSNGRPRSLYEDWNKVVRSVASPEFQDRQATSIKAGDIDIAIDRLEEEYS